MTVPTPQLYEIRKTMDKKSQAFDRFACKSDLDHHFSDHPSFLQDPVGVTQLFQG